MVTVITGGKSLSLAAEAGNSVYAVDSRKKKFLIFAYTAYTKLLTTYVSGE